MCCSFYPFQLEFKIYVTEMSEKLGHRGHGHCYTLLIQRCQNSEKCYQFKWNKLSSRVVMFCCFHSTKMLMFTKFQTEINMNSRMTSGCSGGLVQKVVQKGNEIWNRFIYSTNKQPTDTRSGRKPIRAKSVNTTMTDRLLSAKHLIKLVHCLGISCCIVLKL